MIFPENYILEGNEILLEPLQEHHFNPLLAISVQEPSLLKFSPSPFGTETNFRLNFENALADKKSKKRYPFAIFSKTLGKYIGSTSYANFSQKDARLEIGWTWISEAAQGTGINKSCKFLLLKYAFEHLNILRLEFNTDSRNLRSRRAIEKIGALKEGELRSHTVMQDGYRRNTVVYSILKEDWENIRSTIFKDLADPKP
jgi:RimJ/RimL family protein N-acetyltransferase